MILISKFGQAKNVLRIHHAAPVSGVQREVIDLAGLEMGAYFVQIEIGNTVHDFKMIL